MLSNQACLTHLQLIAERFVVVLSVWIAVVIWTTTTILTLLVPLALVAALIALIPISVLIGIVIVVLLKARGIIATSLFLLLPILHLLSLSFRKELIHLLEQFRWKHHWMLGYRTLDEGAEAVETVAVKRFVYSGSGPPGLKKTDCLDAWVEIYSHALFPLGDLPGQSNRRFQEPVAAEYSIGRDREAGPAADTPLAVDGWGRVPALLLRHPLTYERASLAGRFLIGWRELKFSDGDGTLNFVRRVILSSNSSAFVQSAITARNAWGMAFCNL